MLSYFKVFRKGFGTVKLLLYEWNAYMQTDLELVLKKMNIEFETFSCELGKEVSVVDNYFIRNFGKVLHEGDFDGVMSLNYWKSVAIACDQEHVPYIAWGYDCPLSMKIMESLHYPTNYLFVFDKEQYRIYKQKGFKNVYHIPLAVNVDRLDQIQLTPEERKDFTADISFVGNMYGSDYLSLKGLLTDYERGYLESLIETQYRVYGDFFIDDMITDEFASVIQDRLVEIGFWKTEKEIILDEIRAWIVMLVSREITRRERLLILSTLSRRHPFKLYSREEEKLLQNAEFCGTVSSHYDMPKVFKASRINLNITYKQITVGMPLRMLDIMGAGGFLLTNYQEELVENFRPGTDCVIYESVEDAIAKAEYYLQHEEERQEIAQNGHEAVRRFSYENQLDCIFRTVFGDQYRQSSSSR